MDPIKKQGILLALFHTDGQGRVREVDARLRTGGGGRCADLYFQGTYRNLRPYGLHFMKIQDPYEVGRVLPEDGLIRVRPGFSFEDFDGPELNGDLQAGRSISALCEICRGYRFDQMTLVSQNFFETGDPEVGEIRQPVVSNLRLYSLNEDNHDLTFEPRLFEVDTVVLQASSSRDGGQDVTLSSRGDGPVETPIATLDPETDYWVTPDGHCFSDWCFAPV